MKLFFKYFLLGWLGLILSLSFPQFRISWLAVLLAWGYVKHGKRLAVPLAILFTLLYSYFSVANFLMLLLPLLLSLLFLEGIKKHFSFPPPIRLGTTLLLFWGSLWGFRLPDGFEALGWGAATLLAGLFIPRLLLQISSMLPKKFPHQRSGTEINESAYGLGKLGRGPARRPFGFERELH
jgi:hypothetical protein